MKLTTLPHAAGWSHAIDDAAGDTHTPDDPPITVENVIMNV